MGIELWEAPPRGCCGARVDRPADETALRELLAPLVGITSQGLATVCLSPGCRQVIASRLPTPGETMPAADAGTAQSPRTFDCVQLFAREDLVARLAAAPATSFSPLRVALHSTCHGDHIPLQGPARQPSNLTGTPGAQDGPDGSTEHGTSTSPGQALADLIAMTGAEPLEEVSVAGRCVESPLLPRPANRHPDAPTCLALAAQAGVDVLVTSCFLCFGELNERQRHLDRADPARSVPVLHLAQLLGVASGVAPLRLELGRLAVSARRVLASFVR